jgi:NAD(P)-dependent dehydrogenase (short-subunit alcohol dehydrogenase family)
MRTALVTGVSSGLGMHIKNDLQEMGWKVFGTTHLREFEKEDVFVYNAFNTNYDQSIDGLTSWLSRKLDPAGLDLLVNNAGINRLQKFSDLTVEDLEEIMRVNFITPVMLVKNLFSMLWAARGTVCNIVSDASYKPMRHSLAYNCSKAALAMATRQMARELTKTSDITVFSINPGKMSNTAMSNQIDQRVRELRGWTAEQASNYFAASSVTGKEAHPREVALYVAAIVSNPAVRMLSGACIDLVG